MKKVYSTIMMLAMMITASMCVTACGGSDDEVDDVPIHPYTVSELESVPSFTKSHNSSVSSKYNYKIYIWFRGGKMYYWKDTSSEATSIYWIFDYKLEGYNLYLTKNNKYSEDESYKGYISKVTPRDSERTQMVLNQGDDANHWDGNLPDELVDWYDYSTVDFSKKLH